MKRRRLTKAKYYSVIILKDIPTIYHDVIQTAVGRILRRFEGKELTVAQTTDKKFLEPIYEDFEKEIRSLASMRGLLDEGFLTLLEENQDALHEYLRRSLRTIAVDVGELAPKAAKLLLQAARILLDL